ncbi:MAG: hypothetical protein [Arizlama microvirus]|nr:MAG: hypothetical protein [Arizlama microvirus]
MLQALGLAASFAGGLFGGKKRKKSADKMYHETAKYSDQGIAELANDQARALALREGDEARLRAGTGIDLAKLKSDARASGFNPLTVLAATGGVGYEGRGAVLTSPFIGRADGYFQKASLMSGAGQAVVDNAGYFGDALAGLGGGLFDMGSQAAQRTHERAMQEAMIRGATSSPGAIAGTGVSGGRRGSVPPLVGGKTLTGSPVAARTVLSYSDLTGLPDKYIGPGEDRETVKNPSQNETWWKEVHIGGRDVYVWNDEASDNELASMAMLGSVPYQYVIQAMPDWKTAYYNRGKPVVDMAAAARASAIRTPFIWGRGIGANKPLPIPGQARSH